MCDKCDGIGLIPIKDKQGRTIIGAYQYCDCRTDKPTQYIPLNPQDIDFPISEDWNRFYCQRFGWPNPQINDYSNVLDEIKERLDNIQHRIENLSSNDMRQLKISKIYEEVEDIRQGFRRIDRIVSEQNRKKIPKPSKPRTMEV